MSWIADTALFLGGVYLGIRALAAFYRVIDLWYTIRTAYPVVLRGLAGWAGALLAIAALLGARRAPFVAGALAYLVFYLLLYALRPLLLKNPAPLEIPLPTGEREG